MSDAASIPGLRALTAFMTGRLVDSILNTEAGRRFIDGISGAKSRKQHQAVVRDFAALATQNAVHYLYRPAGAERAAGEPLMKNGRVQWQRALEVTAELLLVLGPVLKLIADYSRSRQGVRPGEERRALGPGDDQRARTGAGRGR